MKSMNLQRRDLHIIRTVINCGNHKYYKDEDVLKACIIEEGKCGASRRPTFRIAYTNINNPIKTLKYTTDVSRINNFNGFASLSTKRISINFDIK